jgi:hypothetical protein
MLLTYCRNQGFSKNFTCCSKDLDPYKPDPDSGGPKTYGSETMALATALIGCRKNLHDTCFLNVFSTSYVRTTFSRNFLGSKPRIWASE